MKKKIILTLFMLFTCFFVFDSVKADMGAPSTIQYDVIVKNIDGASFYDNLSDYSVVTTIPYDTIVTVTWEFKHQDGDWYGNINYNGEYGVINLEDVELVKEEFSLDNAMKLYSEEELILINKEGAYLYSGPSKTYEQLSVKIPSGTKLKYEYVDTYSKVWAYVEYNGVKGWVYIYNALHGPYGLSFAVKTNSSDKVLVVNENIKLYDYPTTDSTVLLSKIPVDTKLSCKYSFTTSPGTYWCYTTYNDKEGWVFSVPSGDSLAFDNTTEIMYVGEGIIELYSDVYESSRENIQIDKFTILTPKYTWYKERFGDPYYYIEYNGNKGWLKTNDEFVYGGYNTNRLYYGISEIDVYDSFECNNKKGTLTQGLEFELKFSYNEKYYVEYNNTTGWILASDLTDTLQGCSNCILPLDSKVNIYADKTTTSKILGEVDSGVNLKTKYYSYGAFTSYVENWYYIEYKGIKGWINTDVSYVVYTDQEIEEDEPNELIEKLEEEVPKKSLHPYQIILLCVGGAVIIAVTVIVIIVLVNKRKKVSLTNNSKTDKKEQEEINSSENKKD